MVQKNRTVPNALFGRGCSDVYFDLSDVTNGSEICDDGVDDTDIEYELNHIFFEQLLG